jgi:hypothetical protein
MNDDKIEEGGMVGTCGSHGTGERSKQGLLGKPERTTLLGRPRNRCEKIVELIMKIRWAVGCKLDLSDSKMGPASSSDRIWYDKERI